MATNQIEPNRTDRPEDEFPRCPFCKSMLTVFHSGPYMGCECPGCNFAIRRIHQSGSRRQDFEKLRKWVLFFIKKLPLSRVREGDLITYYDSQHFLNRETVREVWFDLGYLLLANEDVIKPDEVEQWPWEFNDEKERVLYT